jgi:hypothetical protein
MWLFEICGLWQPRQRHEHAGAEGQPLRLIFETIDDRQPPGSVPSENGALTLSQASPRDGPGARVSAR